MGTPSLRAIAASDAFKRIRLGGVLRAAGATGEVVLVAKINKAQVDSVDNTYMQDNDPRMQKFAERSSKVTFGTGT